MSLLSTLTWNGSHWNRSLWAGGRITKPRKPSTHAR
jgi:hypothetical protein